MAKRWPNPVGYGGQLSSYGPTPMVRWRPPSGRGCPKGMEIVGGAGWLKAKSVKNRNCGLRGLRAETLICRPKKSF